MELGSRRTPLRPPPALLNAGLVAVGVALALLAAELFVRFSGLDPNDQPIPPTAAALPSFRPSERGYFAPYKRAVVEVNTNHLGLRDWNHPGNETTRILGLGDSFTFGFGVELEETYLSVAERELWNRNPEAKIGIYKLGLSGTSQYVQFEALRARWPTIRPAKVVLGFSEDTDIDENVLQDPLLKRVLAGERVSLYSRTAARDVLHRRSALLRFLAARRLRDGLSREIETLENVVRSWGAARPAFEDLLRTGWQRRFIDAFGDKLDYEWQLTEALLDKIRLFVAENGAELVLFRIPSRYAVDPRAWRDEVANVCGRQPSDVRAACGTVDPEHTAKRLESYAKRHGIRYVDPGPTLKASIAAGESIYFPLPEIHWTRRGHRRAGRVLADALAEASSVARTERLPAAPERTRRFAAFWMPPSESSPTASSWLLPLQKDEDKARSQTLLWAEEAGLDFLLLPVAYGDDGEWALGRETSAMVQRIVTERRQGLTQMGFAFRLVASKPEGDPEPSRQAFDSLLARLVESSGPAYARACGRPLLFVDRPGRIMDDRFVLIRGSHGDAIGGAGHPCGGGAEPKGDASCGEVSETARVCMEDLVEGKGFEGDPDLLLATSFNGAGRDRIEPRPPDGRLVTALLGEATSRWKDGEAGDRRPSSRALALYRDTVPLDADLVTERTVSVLSARFSCEGCFPVEGAAVAPFAWTTDHAEMSVHGFSPNGRYAITLRVVDAGAASRLTVRFPDGTEEDVELRPGETTLPKPVPSDADGTLSWSLRVRPFRGRDRIAGSTDERLLGVAMSDVRVVAANRVAP